MHHHCSTTVRVRYRTNVTREQQHVRSSGQRAWSGGRQLCHYRLQYSTSTVPGSRLEPSRRAGDRGEPKLTASEQLRVKISPLKTIFSTPKSSKITLRTVVKLNVPLCKPPLTIRDFVPAWDYRSFVYTDGSKVTGKPTLGAAAVFPGETEDEVNRIKVESEPERHTINRAELAAIAVSLKKKISQPDLRILTDSAFGIYTIRNFGTDPSSYSNHLHVEILRYIDDIIRARDANGLHTHIGKVKSHIDIHYNEVADEAARSIATGDAEPDVTFSAADPPVGGLRTWPLLMECKEDDEDVLTNLIDLKTDAKKNAQKATLVSLQPTTVFGRLLQRAKSQGADYSIHAYSKSTYKLG